MLESPMSHNLRTRSRGVTPVFVDRSGRRLRRPRIALFAGIGLAAAYVVLIVVSLFGVPTVVSPMLAVPSHPQGATSSPTAKPSASPGGSAKPTPEVISPQQAAATTSTATRPSPAASAPATSAPKPTPSPTSSTPGSSGSAPGQSTTSPGKGPTARPTPPGHS